MPDLYDLLAALRARRSDSQQPVWDIRAPGLFEHIFNRQRAAAFPAARLDLLRCAVVDQKAVNLVTGDSEVLRVPGVLPGPGHDHYLLQPDADIEAVDRAALQLGGWYLYACRAPENAAVVLEALRSSDVFRISPTDLVPVLTRLDVTFLIASFYDDSEWRLAAPTGATPKVAA